MICGIKMEDLSKTILCRETQLETFMGLMGDYGEPLPYSIFISGCMSTGKSLCVETVLAHLGYRYVVVNCVESYSQKIMFESILRGLASLKEIREGIKCESLKDLITALNSMETDEGYYEPIVIIFDKAERLRNMEHNLCYALFRLKELCKLNICTIFISHVIYDNFHFKMGVREPIKIFFPNYTKEELFKIIFLQQKAFVEHIISESDVENEIIQELEKTELFANFLNAFLSVFYRPCRDLIELQHMALVNFVKYCEPIIKGDIKAQDLTKLWRNISPILKSNLELLYLRISDTPSCTNSPGKENSEVALRNTNTNFVNTLKEELTSTKTFAQSFELPYYSKYLLIAAYLASYNPAKEDKRLFMKNHGKQRKRLQNVKIKAKISEKLNTQLGPKVFTLDRLLAIFYAILEERIGLTSNLLAQIATLVELRLISGSKEIELDTAKYKCLVGYDFVVAIAQTVGFNVRKYLFDFM